MPWALQIVLGALLIVGVLGGVTSGVLLTFGLLARRARPDRPELWRRPVRRSAQTATLLGVLTVVYPIGSWISGHAWTYGSSTLVTGGLLLLALGSVIRSRLP